MTNKIPLLLSFYALNNNSSTTLIFGQLTYTKLNDLTFKDYSKRKTFRTLLSLYRTKPYAEQDITLVFDKNEVKTKTDSYGSFYFKTNTSLQDAILRHVKLLNGREVKLIDGLYQKYVHVIKSKTILISDIDDTLVHSFIYKKLIKFRTLMYTAVEKRKAVSSMQELVKVFTTSGAAAIYLSNSEANLYPLIYRFLTHNNFPAGPLFLKKMRSLWHVIWNIKFPIRNIHKQSTLEDLLTLFPDKKFILMGDNTQHDLEIYLSISEKFPDRIHNIIIRKVVEKDEDITLIDSYQEKLKSNDIRLYYSDVFSKESFALPS
jgi:phosphatidate phosphatase APP1